MIALMASADTQYGSTISAAGEVVGNGGAGKMLEPAARAFKELRFSHDFSASQAHPDSATTGTTGVATAPVAATPAARLWPDPRRRRWL